VSIIAVLIPVTLVLVAFGIWAFFWAVRTGQFEELDVPGWEILVDERGETSAGPPAAGPPASDVDPLP
jgi:cbb3-type cytochrome oxidase maturation protein